MGVHSQSQAPAAISPNMQQGKLQSSKSSSRLASVPKRLWKARAKSQTRISTGHVGLWIPEGNCRWKSTCGQRVTLQPVSILQLSEIERSAYQQVAMARLKSINISCDIPKEVSSVEKPKRRPALLRRKAATTSIFEGKNGKNKESSQNEKCMVFGIPLSQCIQNDRATRQRSSSLQTQDQLHLTTSRAEREATFGRRSESLSDDYETSFRLKETSGSAESLPVLRPSEGSLDGGANNSGDERLTFRSLLYGRGPQIPQVIRVCLRHLEIYGLNTLGLFRVSSSKKRVRQLREDFDSGQEINLNSDYHPHDIAQLLKEYFRDLPDTLLTRDLYGPLLSTLRLRPVDQLNAQKWLLSLLPVYNRDTLWALTNFLAKVVENSNDRRIPSGEILTGNKMDAHNLATLFGPNILRFSQSGKGKEFLVENNARAEERSDVVEVVRNIFENQKRLFEASAEDMDAVYRRLQVHDPEALDAVMKWRFHNQLEVDTDRRQQQVHLADPLKAIPFISLNDASAQNYIRPLTLAEASPSRSNPNQQLYNTSTTREVASIKYKGREGPTSYGGGVIPSTTVQAHQGQRRESRIQYTIKVNERKNFIEKSASTSAILHPRLVKDEDEDEKEEEEEEEEDNNPERPVAPPRIRSGQPSTASGKNLTSILMNSDRRKSRGTNNVVVHNSSTGVRFQNERWKRWEIIASEYTEQGTLK